MSNLRLQPKSFEGLSADKDIEFKIAGKDLEGDPVDVVLDFGDRGLTFEDTFYGTAAGFESSPGHAFPEASEYTLVLTATDGHNSTVVTLLLPIEEAEDGLPLMLMIGVVASVAAAVVAVFVIKRKRLGKKEEEDIQLP